MCQCIKKRLVVIVDIAAAGIWWIENDLNRRWRCVGLGRRRNCSIIAAQAAL
jgi:hypothetical protein